MQEVLNWIEDEVKRLDREMTADAKECGEHNPVPELLRVALGDCV